MKTNTNDSTEIESTSLQWVKPKIQTPFALITGSSLGIGRAMAHYLANSGNNVLLVALPDEALQKTANELEEKYEVTVISFGIDLTLEEAPQTIFQYCQDHQIRVNILINNAGFGLGGRFENIELSRYYTMMNLNNRAMIGLCHYFIPELKKQPEAYIMNTSSMEATLPLPYKSVYTATKNFIYAFSLAVREELKDTNVSVSVLCPGSVLTNEDGLKRIQAMGWKAKAVVMMPDEVAAYALSRMFRKQQVIIPGKLNWTLAKIGKIAPTGFKMRTLEKLFSAYKEH